MDSTVHVEIPAGHSVMVSFMDFFLEFTKYACVTDWVQVSYTDSESTHTMDRVCSRTRPPPFLADARVLSVHFVADNERRGTGFRLHFSFHNGSATPEQFPDGKWNCSVPYWRDFRYHFPCDLEPECRGGEDEADCPYTTDLCGPGLVSAAGGCYQYVIRDGPLSWWQASALCQEGGGRLASLHSADQWIVVMELAKLRDFDVTRDGVYVGLRTVSPARPAM